MGSIPDLDWASKFEAMGVEVDFDVRGALRVQLQGSKQRKVPTPPNYPTKIPEIPLNRGHKALNGGTLGGVGRCIRTEGFRPLFLTPATSNIDSKFVDLQLRASESP